MFPAIKPIWLLLPGHHTSNAATMLFLVNPAFAHLADYLFVCFPGGSRSDVVSFLAPVRPEHKVYTIPAVDTSIYRPYSFVVGCGNNTTHLYPNLYLHEWWGIKARVIAHPLGRISKKARSLRNEEGANNTGRCVCGYRRDLPSTSLLKPDNLLVVE